MADSVFSEVLSDSRLSKIASALRGWVRSVGNELIYFRVIPLGHFHSRLPLEEMRQLYFRVGVSDRALQDFSLFDLVVMQSHIQEAKAELDSDGVLRSVSFDLSISKRYEFSMRELISILGTIEFEATDVSTQAD